MTDTLIARLRDATTGNLFADRVEAADRIEALQANYNSLKKMVDEGGIHERILSAGIEQEREIKELRAEVEQITAFKDGAYLERNKLVALLSKVFPSGKKKTAIEGWSEDWHGCVYIDLPTGQASWHYHDSQSDLFAHLPEYQGTWDGHTTDEKYERISQFAAEARLTALESQKDGAYEYDGPFGVHQSFRYTYRNGKYPDRSFPVYLAAGAAPTKEPVAWMREDSQWVTDSKSVMEHHKEKGMKFVPLYK